MKERRWVDTSSPAWKTEIAQRLDREDRWFKIFWGVVIALAVLALLWGMRSDEGPSGQFPVCTAETGPPCRDGEWIIARDGTAVHVDNFNAFDLEGRPAPYMRPG